VGGGRGGAENPTEKRGLRRSEPLSTFTLRARGRAARATGNEGTEGGRLDLSAAMTDASSELPITDSRQRRLDARMSGVIQLASSNDARSRRINTPNSPRNNADPREGWGWGRGDGARIMILSFIANGRQWINESILQYSLNQCDKLLGC